MWHDKRDDTTFLIIVYKKLWLGVGRQLGRHSTSRDGFLRRVISPAFKLGDMSPVVNELFAILVMTRASSSRQFVMYDSIPICKGSSAQARGAHDNNVLLISPSAARWPTPCLSEASSSCLSSTIQCTANTCSFLLEVTSARAYEEAKIGCDLYTRHLFNVVKFLIVRYILNKLVGVILTFGLRKAVVYDRALLPEHPTINFNSRF